MEVMIERMEKINKKEIEKHETLLSLYVANLQ